MAKLFGAQRMVLQMARDLPKVDADKIADVRGPALPDGSLALGQDLARWSRSVRFG
jgi:hypothetical protein